MCTEANREAKTRPMIDHPSTIHPSEHHVLGAIKSCFLCHSKSGTLARSSISWCCSGDMIYSLDQQVLGVINFHFLHHDESGTSAFILDIYKAKQYVLGMFPFLTSR